MKGILVRNAAAMDNPWRNKNNPTFDLYIKLDDDSWLRIDVATESTTVKVQVTSKPNVSTSDVQEVEVPEEDVAVVLGKLEADKKLNDLRGRFKELVMS
ncbi:MAG TPA: hypothetical protein VMQ44_01050 [Candidatus Saccharimonadales bacterium]|nr:hypothetical protein [Candidatus Saccharimonadales bacterium]